MATPANLPKPDLSALRIDDRQRSQSKLGKRIFYASIPVLIFAGIVAAAYALRNQRPTVEVTIASKPDSGGRQTLLNASGYVTPRRRATIAAKITGRVTAVYFDEGTHWTSPRPIAIPRRQPLPTTKSSSRTLR
jgi:multidrug efflux pump subunit AcrA (membrane-fusion protein)